MWIFGNLYTSKGGNMTNGLNSACFLAHVWTWKTPLFNFNSYFELGILNRYVLPLTENLQKVSGWYNFEIKSTFVPKLTILKFPGTHFVWRNLNVQGRYGATQVAKYLLGMPPSVVRSPMAKEVRGLAHTKLHRACKEQRGPCSEALKVPANPGFNQ